MFYIFCGTDSEYNEPGAPLALFSSEAVDMLTRMHYNAITAVLHAVPNELMFNPSAEYVIKLAARRLADYFASDNPGFDRERFLRATLGKE